MLGTSSRLPGVKVCLLRGGGGGRGVEEVVEVLQSGC